MHMNACIIIDDYLDSYWNNKQLPNEPAHPQIWYFSSEASDKFTKLALTSSSLVFSITGVERTEQHSFGAESDSAGRSIWGSVFLSMWLADAHSVFWQCQCEQQE